MKLKSLFMIGLVAIGLPISAQNLDTNVYSKIKESLTLTRHSSSVDLRASINRISSNPVPYLVAISQESGVRIYVKEKAIYLLKDYQTDESANFLRSRIEQDNIHPSLRKFAVKGYTDGFYTNDPLKVETFLKKFQSDKKIGTTVVKSLQKVRFENFRKTSQPTEVDLENLRKNKPIKK
ncbi:hypothetical protein [Leptospira saintgironsiae]|uniref:Uncharacterized protein n=1 Tax=Leptospira saintgironsiae TaxID=2023183 RepID=A0A2M9YGH5_9LEPT|nr:hypothetical protein [Leptospira saintgironsiae]PJZ50624.1 hypothetical protein CH362_02340 [Leptospira saintgironsiae]